MDDKACDINLVQLCQSIAAQIRMPTVDLEAMKPEGSMHHQGKELGFRFNGASTLY